jgi:dipeptidyl aminopeptidase/acylaminoacyl peptidase
VKRNLIAAAWALASVVGNLIKMPLLLAYGAKELRMPIAHGERLRDALMAAGNPPEWVVYAEEGHGWYEVATRADFARRVEAFLQRHLGPTTP